MSNYETPEGEILTPVDLSKLTNNSWYKINLKSNTVFVFAHGIFSESHDCWRHDDKKDASRVAFWPDLVSNDPRLENPSVYLGGYFTQNEGSPHETEFKAR